MFDSIFDGKKILITGHTGFKGSWLTLWLQSLGAEICGYSDRVLESPSHFSMLKLGDSIRHELGDVCDYDRLVRLITDFKPDVIFHLAAQALVHQSHDDPLGTVKSNTLGTATLVHAARSHPALKGLVVITSDKVYANQEWAWGYREADRLGGHDPYSASKAAAELLIDSFLKSYFTGTDTIAAIGRAGNVIGGGDWAANRIIPDCVRAWSMGEAAAIRNPLATRPWQHVLEPLSGYMRLAEMALMGEAKIHHQAYNFGPPANVDKNVAELLSAMQTHWPQAQWTGETDPAKLKVHEAGLLKLTCDKAHQDLGWSSQWDFEATVKQTCDWYRAYATDETFDARAFSLKQIATYGEEHG